MTVLYSVPTAANPTGEIVLQSQLEGSEYAAGEYAAGELAADEVVESEETTNPVLPEVHEIFWSAVFFILLWMLMKYVLLPPIRRLQAARKQKLQDDQDAAAQAELDYKNAKVNYEEALASARQDANELMEQVRNRASSRRQEIIADATASVATARATATAEIAEARQRAIEDLRPQLRTLAVQAATDVLGRAPSETQQAAADRYLLEIGAAGNRSASAAGDIAPHEGTAN